MTPHSPGCRCPECHPGLGVYAPDPVAYQAFLRSIKPTPKLSLVSEQAHTMVCDCGECKLAREHAQKARKQPAQPWEPRKPRERAA